MELLIVGNVYLAPLFQNLMFSWLVSRCQIAVGYSFISMIPYSVNFSRTINFAVFVDFTATSKINPRKSYYSIQMQ